MYILDSDDRHLLKEIFFRVNKYGKALAWDEVYDALYGHDGPAPATIGQLSRELESVGMGKLDPGDLTSCLLAVRGLDVTRTLAEHRRRDPDVLRGAVADALPVLRSALDFLRSQAQVPHLRLLPRTFVLEILGRFFTLHHQPSARSLQLLTRWTWRVFLSEGRYDERNLRRRAVTDIGKDEEDSIQRLLDLVPRDQSVLAVPSTFDARAARSRLSLLALRSLSPRDLQRGSPIDVAELLESRGAEAFRHVVPVRPPAVLALRSPANRILLPGSGSARQAIIEYIEKEGSDNAVLRSHGISSAAARALEAGAYGDFVANRASAIMVALGDLGDRLAGWATRDRDRPSIKHLLDRSQRDS